VPITFSIDGRQVPESHIDAWEQRRLKAVLRRLDAPIPTTIDLKALRVALAERKRSIGYGQLTKRLRIGLLIADWMAKLLNSISGNRRASCVVTAHVDGLSAEQAARGLESLWLSPSPADDLVNLAACPDHYALVPRDGECLEVIEATGGSPLPTRFFVDRDESGLTTPRDSSYPQQAAGTARLKDGTVIGGIRHQLRDTASGLEARLCVEFPARMPRYLIRQHQLHLACEFRHWFRHLHDQHVGSEHIDT